MEVATPSGPVEAVLFNGLTAEGREVTVRLEEHWLRIFDAGLESDPVTVHIGVLDFSRNEDGNLRATRQDRPGWMLRFRSDVPDGFIALLDNRSPFRLWLARHHVTRSLAVVTIAVILVVLSLHFYIDRLAYIVPRGMSEAIGRSVLSWLAAPETRCKNKEGLAVLEGLAHGLRPAGFDRPLVVHVARTPIRNAFAAPGGRIVIFDSLIQEAEGPDMVAGVLAHEIGHVHHRHPMKGLLRSVGIGLFIQALGGDIGASVDTIASLSRTREQEREADRTAARILVARSISPVPLGKFFESIAQDNAENDSGYADVMSYLSTHPDPANRAAYLFELGEGGGSFSPALDAKEWQALRSICDASEGEA